MVARLGTLITLAVLVVGCSATQVTPGPSGAPSPSPASAAPASPSPSATPSPTATPIASPTPSTATALAWQRLGSFRSPDNDYGRIVGFAGGYVVLSRASVFFSPDGRTWTPADLPFHHSKDQHGIPLEDEVRSIASDGTTVVIVGGYGHVPCTPANGATGGGPECLSSPISWVSTDGRSWRTSYPWRGPATPKPYKQGLEFSTVWAVPTGGWDAALDYIAGEAGGAGAILHSADGLTWTALASSPPTELKGVNAPPPELWGPGAADPTGRRIVAGTWYIQQGDGALAVTHLFTSTDGHSWKAIDAFPGTNGEVYDVVAPSSDHGLWIICGSDTAGSPTVWTSTDLATWSTASLPLGPTAIGGQVTALAATKLGFVALGTLADGPDVDSYRASWVSADGRDWVRLPAPDGASGGPDVAADGPAGPIGIDSNSNSDAPAVVWMLK